MNETILDNKAREAVAAATEAATKIEVVRQDQLNIAAENVAVKAAQLAAENVSQRVVDERRMGDIVQDRVEHVLARGTEQDKSIILARVPYICQDIKNINKVLENIQDNTVTKDDFLLIRNIVFGFIGIIVVGFMGSLMVLVFR